jgi:hypothetical protein
MFKPMRKLAPSVAALVSGLLLLVSAAAEPPKQDRKKIRQMLDSGKLYLRVDAPCVTGRHPFGVYYSPLVEVSPDGVNTEEREGVGFGMYHADSAYWGIRVNDAVRFDDMEWDENTVEVEFEGVGDAEDESTVIAFVDVHSFADFERAFGHVFATAPLQDQHDDWPAEVKQAIADRRLSEGMTKRQVYYITGAPESFERRDEDGVNVEVWRLRQRRGMKMGYFRMSAGELPSGLPEELRFEDGLLVNVIGSGTGSGFDLDN